MTEQSRAPDSAKEVPVIAGVDVQKSASSSSFRALSRLAFFFVRDQALTLGAMAWSVRDRGRPSKNGVGDHD